MNQGVSMAIFLVGLFFSKRFKLIHPFLTLGFKLAWK